MSLLAEIEKTLGDFQLNVSFNIENESLAVVGASGAGKSITLKCIAGIITPDRGRIVLDGRVLFDSDKKINVLVKEREIGYLFQNYALFPKMTVAENIAFGVRKGKQECKAIVQEFIERYYLKGCEKLYPHQLSGGQQQRTALARMLAASPKLLMFDEPLSALDTYLRWQMEQEIAGTIREFKGSTLLVSHNMEEVYRLCEQAIIMEQGRIEIQSSKNELFRQPETLSAALLTGYKNISRAEKIDHETVMALDWGIRLKMNEPVIEGLKYIAIPSDCVVETASMEAFNVLEPDDMIVMEDMEAMILIFRQKGNKEHSDWSRLRYELAKAEWTLLKKKNSMFLRIPESKVIQMR